jgi:soluble lytic murein transglycosylase-like protein
VSCLRCGSTPGMRKRLQLALMASSVIATSLSFSTPLVQAQSTASSEVITATTDDVGRTIYVNEPVVQPRRPAAPARTSSSLMYWSVTARRWKPVPSANVRAARSAAAEVNHYFERPAARSTGSFTASDIESAIQQAAARHNVDPNLVRAVIKVESNFNPNAVSRKGAMGLMQLMPQTARQLHVSNPFDPQQNVDAGVRHLKKLIENYGGDIKLSLAAYNAGPGAVARSAGVPHFAETRDYVKRITELYSHGSVAGSRLLGGPVRNPVTVQRDSRGVLYISNTD